MEAVYYSAQLQLSSSMSKSQKKERAEMVIKEFGLQDAMNTRIGGWGAKGLSGGQKRRVSICIEILTRPKLLFLDEPTSGLDSAAAYYVMSRIARQRRGKTIVASIHQPSSEVFNLFQNVCLLSSGKTVYFGPANAANEFFAANGFPCPTLQNPSDHFLNTINKDFDEDIEEGSTRKMPTEEAINILVNSYQSSQSYREVQKQVSEICTNETEVLEGNRNRANFIDQCLVLTRRSSVNMFRDIGYYWMRLAVYTAIALGLGTIFYHVVDSSPSSVQAIGSMLMFVSAFLTFMAIGGFPSFVEEMKVFQRERMNGHYDPGAFAIGNLLSAFPFLLLVSLIPGAIAYFLTGYQRGLDPGKVVDHFFYFVALLFACMMLVESLMMVIASLVPNFLMGIIVGAGVQGLMMLSGGFFRLADDLPKPVWKYPLYYIAFHTYAFQGLFKNEFLGRTFPNYPGAKPSIISGEMVLRNTFQIRLGHSKWVDLGILFGMVIIYRFLFFVIVRVGEKVKPNSGAALMSAQPLKKDKKIAGTGMTSAGTSPLI
ncbi:OLC1v1002674C2 [Oldenlandia corymbosa var. corymbosa]|nr:OLC1v1002674C2 [Oldenlandia corymbosa var. corymbosa]